MTHFSQIQPINLRERVVEQIRTAIIEGKLRPNDHITEAVLTEELGVSRTPVREALILLEREGLIISVPNRGSFVRAFTEKDVIHIFSMRTTLENFAVELIIDHFGPQDFTYLRQSIERQALAIQQGDIKGVRSTDMAFHRYIIDASKHSLLIRHWTELVAQIAALLYMRAEAMPNYDETLAISDHTNILHALEQRDLAQVKALNAEINQRVAENCREAVCVLLSDT